MLIHLPHSPIERTQSIFIDSSEIFVDSSQRYGHQQCTADNFGAGKYNDMPSPAAHLLLEKRDNMIASTQNELAAVNLKLSETQSKLDEVNKQAAEIIPQLTRDLERSRAKHDATNLSLKDAHSKINSLDVMLASQDEIRTAVVTELKRVASELDQTTNY